MRLAIAALMVGCCFAPTPPASAIPVAPYVPTPPEVATLPTCEGAQCPILAADAVAAEGSTVWVATERGIVAIDDDGVETRVIAMTTTHAVTSMALSATHVYWAELGSFEDAYAGAIVARAPREGGERETLRHVPHFAKEIAIDDLGVCWVTDIAQLECGDRDGHDARVVFEPVTVFALGAETEPREIFVQNNDVFAAVPRAGGSARVIDAVTPELPTATRLVRGDDGIYVAEQTTLIFGGIARRALDGSGRVALAHGQWSPRTLAFLGDRVLGPSSEIGLVSVPRAGGAATLPVPHGTFEDEACIAITDRWVWLVQGDPSMAYRIPRAEVEAAATAPAAPL